MEGKVNAKETGDERSKTVVSDTVRVNFAAGTGATKFTFKFEISS